MAELRGPERCVFSGGAAMAIALFVTLGAAAGDSANEKGYAPVNGTTLYYETAGVGEPVVFLHGGFMDRRMWDEQFLPLSKSFRTVRYDQRGYGKSLGNTREPFSPVEDLAGLLDYLKLEKVHIVGLSMGGNLALDFAVEHPTRLLSLVHVNGGMSGVPFQFEASDEPNYFMQALSTIRAEGNLPKALDLFLGHKPLFRTLHQNNPAAVESVRKMVAENSHTLIRDPGEFQAVSLDDPAAERLDAIRFPVLSIVGEHNDAYGHTVSDLLEAEVAGATKVVIPGTGHMVNMEKAAEFNQLLMGFLSEPRGQ